MTDLSYFVDRTDQKLRFARIHIEELRNHPSRNSGDDFERAHHEAILMQMYGATDAFLQELNIHYSCGLAPDQVSRARLAQHLKTRNVTAVELLELEALVADADGYLGQTKDRRHHITHRGGVPMKHYFNGPSKLVHPKTRDEIKTDTIELFDDWLARLTSLLARLRASASKIGA